MKIITLFLSSIKSTHFKVGTFFTTFLSIVVIRTFFEYIFESSHFIATMDNFYDNTVEYFHILLSWLSVFLSIVFVLNIFDKEKISNTIKIVLNLFGIIIIVPILDYSIFESGKILYETDFNNFWFKYIYLFDITKQHMPNITNGVRVEIALVSIFSYIYIYTIRKNIWISITAMLFVYTSIFFYGYLPAIINFMLDTTYSTIVQNSVLITKSMINLNFYTYLPILSILFLLYFIKLDKKYKYLILDSFRFERLSIYLGLFLFGFFVSIKHNLIEDEIFNLYDILKAYSALLSISFSFVYATMLNNFYDIKIDRLSNKKRALIRYDIPLQEYLDIKNIFLFFAFIFAIGVNSEFIFLIIALIALSYIYSAYPLRFKRYFILSNITLSSIAVLVFLSGICLVEGNIAFIQSDKNYLLAIFIFFFIAANLKDIKDTSSDKLHKITTLSTLIGTKKAFIILKIFVFLGFLLVMNTFNLSLFSIALLSILYIIGALYITTSEKMLIFIQCIAILIYILSIY